MNTESASLTAREMFDILLAGKKVAVIAHCEQDPDLIKLLNHLNVVKCRSRKVYESLGLAWENSIIQIKPPMAQLKANEQAIISLTIPNPPRKYGAFIILENDESNTNKNDTNIVQSP